MFWLDSRVWLLFAGIVLLAYIIFGGASYFNVFKIVKKYVDVFRGTNKHILKRHLFFFFCFPMILAIASNLHRVVDDELLSVIGVVVSILTSALYSFLGTISAKRDQVTQNMQISSSDFKRQITLHKETISIIHLEILVSILLLILCFAQPALSGCNVLLWENDIAYIGIKSIISGFIYYLFYFFILNLLVVLKRFYVLTKS